MEWNDRLKLGLLALVGVVILAVVLLLPRGAMARPAGETSLNHEPEDTYVISAVTERIHPGSWMVAQDDRDKDDDDDDVDDETEDES
jgi:hypothetical protein